MVVQEVKPYTIHYGSYFYYTQAVYRQFQAIGLNQTYRKKAKISKFLRKMFAMGFVPQKLVAAPIDSEQAKKSSH